MLEYDIILVNGILNSVYSNIGESIYAIPIDEKNPKRIAFDSWLSGTGVTPEETRDVNYATAYLRVYYMSLFECNSCTCIPPILSHMGFGVTLQKSGIFNYSKAIENSCCD